jgi:dephospho-CoA kinase
MAETGNQPRVVVFGGIGSGKSTFTNLLGDLGAVVIEADRIGHEILASAGAAFAEVAAIWPQVVIEGEIDRSALGAIVFADPEALLALEAITHPLIRAEVARRAEAAAGDMIVVELPLIGEVVGPGWTWLLIDAPRDVRLARAVARGADADDIRARMASQPSDEEFHDKADWIVPNTGSLEDLTQAAAELWEKLVDQE